MSKWNVSGTHLRVKSAHEVANPTELHTYLIIRLKSLKINIIVDTVIARTANEATHKMIERGYSVTDFIVKVAS